MTGGVETGAEVGAEAGAEAGAEVGAEAGAEIEGGSAGGGCEGIGGFCLGGGGEGVDLGGGYGSLLLSEIPPGTWVHLKDLEVCFSCILAFPSRGLFSSSKYADGGAKSESRSSRQRVFHSLNMYSGIEE